MRDRAPAASCDAVDPMTTSANALLSAFHSSDVSVRDALFHLHADIDRRALCQVRIDGNVETIDESLCLLEGTPSALLLEAFVARPLETLGLHERALAVRTRALAMTPRWDPWQSGLLLTATARSLLALDRADDAAHVGREALRHAPLDPSALLAVAMACATSDPAKSLSIRAFLRDAGFGPPIVSGPPLTGEREVAAWEPALSDVAPMSDEDVARYLVMRDLDEGFAARRRSDVRHIAMLIRRGDLGIATCVAHYTRSGDAGSWNLLETWLGFLQSDDVVWTAREVQKHALDATEAGKEAIKRTRSKVPNRHSCLVAYNYDKRFLQDASEDDLATLIFHLSRTTMIDALAHAPGHPLVARFVALRRELVDRFPYGPEGQWFVGTTGPTLHGHHLVYPEVREDLWTPSVFPERLVKRTDRKGKCTKCKVTLEIDEVVLELGDFQNGEPRWKRFHPTCAEAMQKMKGALLRARERARVRLGGA